MSQQVTEEAHASLQQIYLPSCISSQMLALLKFRWKQNATENLILNNGPEAEGKPKERVIIHCSIIRLQPKVQQVQSTVSPCHTTYTVLVQMCQTCMKKGNARHLESKLMRSSTRKLWQWVVEERQKDRTRREPAHRPRFLLSWSVRELQSGKSWLNKNLGSYARDFNKKAKTILYQ